MKERLNILIRQKEVLNLIFISKYIKTIIPKNIQTKNKNLCK